MTETLREPQTFRNKVLWTNETKINLYQNDGKAKVWRKKGHATAWACTAASGVDSLIFIDDETHDSSARMNSEVYENILPANLQRNASKQIGRNLHFARQLPKTHCQHN